VSELTSGPEEALEAGKRPENGRKTPENAEKRSETAGSGRKRPRGRLRRRAEAAIRAEKSRIDASGRDSAAVGLLYGLTEALDALFEPFDGQLEGLQSSEALVERAGKAAYVAQTALRVLSELQLTPASAPDELEEATSGLAGELKRLREAG